MSSVTFGPFQLDLGTGELHRSGVAVKLQPQPSKLLVLLVERAGEVVTRDEIRQRVWGHDTFVDFDQSVNFCIRQIRTALHDHAATPCYLETVPRRGYRFIAPVQTVNDQPVPPARIAIMLSRQVSWQRASGAAAVVIVSAVVVMAAATYKQWNSAESATRNPQPASRAHQEVELGRFFLNKFSADGALTAIEHFEAATRDNADYAPAYAGLADAYNQLATVFIAGQRPADVRLLALRAATRAIQLDSRLAEAYTALGYATMHEMDWIRAGSALRRAIQLNPEYVPARQIYATYLADQRRFADAIEEARKGLDLEPASVRGRQMFAWMLYFARQYDSAISELRTIVQMDRTYALAHFRLGQVLLVMGRAAEAIPELQTAVEMTNRAPAALGLLAMAFGAGGERAEAQRIVDDLETRSARENVPAGALLLAYLGVDDTRRAVDMVERGYVERDNYEINIAADPLMDPLRNDPRFQALCRQVMLGSGLMSTDLRIRTTPIARP